MEDLRLKCFRLEEDLKFSEECRGRLVCENLEYVEFNKAAGQAVWERERELKKLQEYYDALSKVKNQLKAENDSLRLELAAHRVAGCKPQGDQGVHVPPGPDGVSRGTP